ncbi:PQQ-dependent sugar dehydrogenase [Lentzea flava]|uniref:Oxidoreductase n=1 Tax=Lentzea flava TaxID=103732 RepID=A0ABQ2ULC3_9PSEU|nr:PQQ-dependent sugar dehydrogenase [Lentzea flava]MCP2200401.1 Glucose/arabinose dehydrogenase, beta-propeller fold [Lentzea flava]GGU42842.1 oxidoreductase [Lentzea flava]
MARRLLAVITALALTAVAAPPAQADDVLLSLAGPATASSESNARHVATKATDLDRRTTWRSEGGGRQWIAIDLGSMSTINRVVLRWGALCARKYAVQTSPEGVYWRDVHSTDNGDGGDDNIEFTGFGRWIRVSLTTPCFHAYELREFEVHGTPGVVDTTPPSAPGTLSVKAFTPTSVNLQWGAASDNVAVANYEIYQSGQYVKTVDGLSNNITRLTPNTTYSFYVNAKDAAGNISQASNSVTVTTPPAVVDTGPPTTPSTAIATKATANSVSLAWGASSDDVAVASYAVFSGGVQVGTTTGLQTTIAGLKQDTAYEFVVKAVDTAGKSSPFTAPIKTATRKGHDAVGEVTKITDDTDVPWGLEFLRDGTAFYAQRDTGDIIRIAPNGEKTVAGRVPNVVSTDGEGGLLGLEHKDGWLYAYHTSPTDNRLVRFKLVDGKLDAHQVLLTGAPRNKFHNGGRLRFGPDGKLYIATGDGQVAANAQDLNSLGGKVLRVNPDGSVPRDNPFPGKYVYSYGHRNVQGLAFDSRGRLWEAEFGNSVMDEINLIRPGGNYGWPACEGTSGQCGEFIAPKHTWPVSQASPSGLTIVDDVLYLAALRGQRLYRIPIGGQPEIFFEGSYGRLRTVEKTPRGDLWLTTSNGDKDSIPNNSTTQIYRIDLK